MELLLVMAILTVLFGIVIFAIRPEDIYQDSNRPKIESDRKEIQTAYTQYKLNSDGQSPFGENLINGINYKNM